MVLQPPVNRNLFDSAEAKGLGLETLPATLEEAVQVAEESEFLRRCCQRGFLNAISRRSSSAAPHCGVRLTGPSTSASTILTPSDPCQRRRKECGKWDAH